ncbi:MAG: Prepilin-type N-terminal cleavage/methylation domain protein [Parcubacteria bacterium 34_609]|nr:MAG: Prepilin-type N-terminal cleavage/methylation domain protein [Parcubacteria bacterium 34_609]KUK98962.1 MAG: Prepilin-type N-terminal cleavage/methylation domain protein [Parcubacteria bacterium 32_520]
MLKYIRKKRFNDGFTLIELMVVIAVLSFIILGLVTFFSGGVRSWIAGQNQLKAQREARQVMDRMVREIREASYIDDSSSNIYTIEFYNPNKGKEIKYSYNGTDKEIKEGSNSSLLKNVSVFSFSYYNNNGDVVDPPDMNRISSVKIYLEVNVDNDENPDIVLESEVNLRNFMLSYDED